MPTKGTTVIAFRLKEDLVAAVDRAAKKRGVSRNKMVAALFSETYAKGASDELTPATQAL